MISSTFLVRSTNNSSFGTAFCVHSDDHGAYLVTCTHVVEECGMESLEVNGQRANCLYHGSRDDIDLAVVYVEGLLDCKVLRLSNTSQQPDTMFTIEGFKRHKTDSYLLRMLNGSLQTISQIYFASKTIYTYELLIENEYTIEKGYSGSAIVSNGEVIAVATDRNSNGKQAYAIPITYLKEIWQTMPHTLFLEEEIEQKSNFSHEVFETLDNNPLLLFSTDSYNHADYIEHIKEEAVERFGQSYVVDINCRRFTGIRDSSKFFNRMSKILGLGDNIEDSFDFEEVMVERFKSARPLKTFILIVGFECLDEEILNVFAESLRSLHEQCRRDFNLVIFGGEKLIKLKYSTGKHSYFNIFNQKMIPASSFQDWKSHFGYLSKKSYDEVLSVTGGYQKLTKYCFEKKVQTAQEAKKLIYESYFKSDLFFAYEDNLCTLLNKKQLGDAHPYSDNELLYRLYWDNLIVEVRGQFVWRSAFIVGLGREFLGCVEKRPYRSQP